MDYTPQCVFTTIILVISLSWWCCGRPEQTQVIQPDSADDRIVPEERAQAEAPPGDESKAGNEDQIPDEKKAAEDEGEVQESVTPVKVESPAGSDGSISQRRKKPKKEKVPTAWPLV
eukprot:TRINITY_DN2987_c0_g1_i1.p1 TRINITY_DN2987_c0_g1~~TRINITY_DN2987_c0_g1_i1.p1  ORF type:complete len:117 (+),score=36.98 TRINITY_DN2987_c0_g1_i1:85-435(+)